MASHYHKWCIVMLKGCHKPTHCLKVWLYLKSIARRYTKYDVYTKTIITWLSRVWYWIEILIFQYLKQGLNSSIIGRLIQHIYEHASVPHTSFNDLFDMVTGGDGWSKDQSIRAMALQSIICVTQRIYYKPKSDHIRFTIR